MNKAKSKLNFLRQQHCKTEFEKFKFIFRKGCFRLGSKTMVIISNVLPRIISGSL